MHYIQRLVATTVKNRKDFGDSLTEINIILPEIKKEFAKHGSNIADDIIEFIDKYVAIGTIISLVYAQTLTFMLAIHFYEDTKGQAAITTARMLMQKLQNP